MYRGRELRVRQPRCSRVLASVLLSTLVFAGCAAKATPASVTTCSPAEQRLCPCPDGLHSGVQTCGADGMTLGACGGCPASAAGVGPNGMEAAAMVQPMQGSAHGGSAAPGGSGASGHSGAGGATMVGSGGGVAVGSADAGNRLADAGSSPHADAGAAGDAGDKDAMVGKCGNGVIDPGEECDGASLNSMTCASLSYKSGTLLCSPTTCRYDTSMCTAACWRACPGH